jgi:hypothetical protein
MCEPKEAACRSEGQGTKLHCTALHCTAEGQIKSPFVQLALFGWKQNIRQNSEFISASTPVSTPGEHWCFWPDILAHLNAFQSVQDVRFSIMLITGRTDPPQSVANQRLPCGCLASYWSVPLAAILEYSRSFMQSLPD